MGGGTFWRQRAEVADLVQLYRTGVPAQVIIHNNATGFVCGDERGRRDLRAGFVDGRPFHHQPRRPHRALQRSIEARDVASGRFVPARHFDARSDIPNWNDVAPRFGFAWDVQGTGKTAVKMGIGKYVRAYSTGFAEPTIRTLHQRDADLDRPERGRYGARDPRLRLPLGRLRDRLLDVAANSGPSRCRIRPTASAGRIRSKPT